MGTKPWIGTSYQALVSSTSTPLRATLWRVQSLCEIAHGIALKWKCALLNVCGSRPGPCPGHLTFDMVCGQIKLTIFLRGRYDSHKGDAADMLESRYPTMTVFFASVTLHLMVNRKK